jgi:hypothetical protein
MALKAAVKTRKPTPTPAAVRGRQLGRLEDAVGTLPYVIIGDELLATITTTVHATLPGGQKSRHVADAIAASVKAVCDNLRRRGRRAA